MASEWMECFTKKKKKKIVYISRGQMLALRRRDVCISQAQTLDGKLVYWMFNIDNIGM